MSTNIPVGHASSSGTVAPTPQNTPLSQAPINLGLSRPTVPDISEDPEHDDDADADAPINAHGGLPSDAQDQLAALLGGGAGMGLGGFMSAKLAGLIERSGGYVEALPVETKRNVEALKGVQVKSVALMNAYKRESLALENKYNDLQKPVYDRRLAIISGAAEGTAEEIAAGEEAGKKDDPDYESLASSSEPSADPVKGIPQFWLTALRNHVGLSELITDRDAAALAHLLDIRLAYLPPSAPQTGFKLIFSFAPNDFFTDETLEKTYFYQAEVGYHGDLVYERAVGCEIHWKEEKDLTKEFEIKKQRNKNTNRTRLVRKAHPTESFFNFFTPPVPPAALEEEDADDADFDDLEEKLELDYQIGEDIKERIIPRAVDYFTGKALEYEDFEEDEEDEDWDDEDEEEDDEDDDEEEDTVPVRRRAGGGGRGRRAGGRGGAGAQVNPEDCKQQ